MRKKMLFIMATILVFTLFVPNVRAVAVKNQEEFYTQIAGGKNVEITSEVSIKLEDDLDLTTKVTVGAFSGSEVSVTFDLNGHTLKLSGGGYFYVQNKGKLIVEDSVGTGLITNAGATSAQTNLVHVSGKCEINGGTLDNTLASKNALFLQAGASCTLNDGKIMNSFDKSGRAVKVTNATFTMNGGTIVNKAKGGEGWLPAVDGHTFIMNGGRIESAGTGVAGTSASVIIKGGTIDADYFAFHTSNLVVEPDAGKEVNISAGRAILDAYNAPKDENGQAYIGNVIKGGNFDAPLLMEKDYVSDETNLEVHDGVFTAQLSDLSDYVADGKYAEKVGENYEIKEYSQNVEIVPVDPSEEVADTTVGLKQNEEVEDTLIDSLEEAVVSDPVLKEAVSNNNVVVSVDVTSLNENELDNEVVDKFENVSENLVVADYFDINVLVNDNNNNRLGFISELTKDIELVIVLPEKYINNNEKVNRVYYVIREHDGQVEILEDVKVSEDGKSIIFKSNKFSTYALAYEDKVIEAEKVLPPKTGDINLEMLALGILIGIAGVVIASKKLFAKGI